MVKKKVLVIGGGAAAIAFSLFIDTSKFDVHLFEKKKTQGRKFLVAGNGGFNLTHGADPNEMLSHYTPKVWMQTYFNSFTNVDFQVYLKSIGFETFTGSSNRVFPKKGIKPSLVLKTMTDLMDRKGIIRHPNSTWCGKENHHHSIDSNGLMKRVEANLCVFALGGASWSKTGSDGLWASIFRDIGITTLPFQASNMGWECTFPNQIGSEIEGSVLKNIAVQIEDIKGTGELMITSYGLEGGPLYKLSGPLRKAFAENGRVEVNIDFKPTISKQELLERVAKSSKNLTTVLRENIKLSKAQIKWIKASLSKGEFQHTPTLVETIKAFPVFLERPRPIEEAISTVGGIARSELDVNLQINKLPNHYCIGEMIDWDAPTGGYLLQACFSMGVYLANHLNKMYE